MTVCVSLSPCFAGVAEVRALLAGFGGTAVRVSATVGTVAAGCEEMGACS